MSIDERLATASHAKTFRAHMLATTIFADMKETQIRDPVESKAANVNEPMYDMLELHRDPSIAFRDPAFLAHLVREVGIYFHDGHLLQVQSEINDEAPLTDEEEKTLNTFLSASADGNVIKLLRNQQSSQERQLFRFLWNAPYLLVHTSVGWRIFRCTVRKPSDDDIYTLYRVFIAFFKEMHNFDSMPNHALNFVYDKYGKLEKSSHNSET